MTRTVNVSYERVHNILSEYISIYENAMATRCVPVAFVNSRSKKQATASHTSRSGIRNVFYNNKIPIDCHRTTTTINTITTINNHYHTTISNYTKNYNSTDTDNNNNNNNNNDNNKWQWYVFNRKNIIILSSVAAAGIGIYGIYNIYGQDVIKTKQLTSNNRNNNILPNYHTIVRKDLPTYRMTEVSKYNSIESGGIWVTYGIGVYDITKFIPQHPGSDKIMLAAGNAIDPFWQIFQQHNTVEILNILEKYRIGNLNEADEIHMDKSNDPWINEPKRHSILKVASQKPFNAEPSISILPDSFITPVEFFYIRNHLPVPVIDIQDYELDVVTENPSKTLTLKYDDIKKLPKYTVTAAIMCGGNRRSEMNQTKPVKGLSWNAAAVGNANWSGAKLYEILHSLNVESDERRHVHFEGLDIDPTSTPYAASIPLSKAMDPRSDIILAYEMNGKPLNRDHGYPIRIVIPGVVGARNVKWLGRIVVSDKESNSHWQQNDYKGFGPSTDWDTVDFTKSPAIQNMPVTSAICTPEYGQNIKLDKDGCITVKGYAWSGGGNKIVRVDVTTDGGQTWHTADLIHDTVSKENSESIKNAIPTGRHWPWTLWTIKIPIKNTATNEIEIWSKAVDSNYNVQPESFENIWNLRGVLSNAYHRVKIILS